MDYFARHKRRRNEELLGIAIARFAWFINRKHRPRAGLLTRLRYAAAPGVVICTVEPRGRFSYDDTPQISIWELRGSKLFAFQ